MNIIDIWIDGADGAALDRVNVHFNLQLPRRRFWIFKECNSTYRERIREAVRNQYSQIGKGT